MNKLHGELNARRLASLCALSAAGVAATAGQDADAAIIYTTVNEDIGFGTGNSSIEILPLAGGIRFGVATTTFAGFSRSLFIAGTSNANFQVKTQVFGNYGFALPLAAGLKFDSAPGGASSGGYLEYVSSSGSAVGPGKFTDMYYAFSFVSAGKTLYGWVLGSLTDISYDGLSYHLTSYAYEDTGIQIATGQLSPAVVPEPASASLALLGGALVAGAAGVRRWKKAKAEEAVAAA